MDIFWNHTFPPFSILQQVLQKISEEEATGLLVVPNWPTQIWWPYLMNMLIDFPLILPRKEDTLPTSTSSAAAPTAQETSTTGLPLVRDLLTSKGVSAGAATIIMQSWQAGTQKQYHTYHQRWRVFCRSRGIKPISASLEDGLEFLHHQYENGLPYSGINTARSALSTVIFLPDGSSFGNHPLVSRFLKGVFESRPSLPRYKDISHKTVMLVALLSGQLCQTVHALTIY